VILDEATAGIDVGTEARIREAPGRLLAERTALGSVSPDEVPFTLAQYENFVFLPDWPEPCGRSILEASFAGCTLNLNHNLTVLVAGSNGDLDRVAFAAPVG
jgi:hypothetical protein